MVKNMIIFLSLLVILVCVMCIFNARHIAKKRFKHVEENKMTKIINISISNLMILVGIRI